MGRSSTRLGLVIDASQALLQNPNRKHEIEGIDGITLGAEPRNIIYRLTCFHRTDQTIHIVSRTESEILHRYLHLHHPPNTPQSSSHLRQIISVCSLRCLLAIHGELKQMICEEPNQKAQKDHHHLVPIFGSKDNKTIKGLGEILANWSIYPHLTTIQPCKVIEHQLDCFSEIDHTDILRSLVSLILPSHTISPPTTRLKKHLIFDPRYALQSVLYPTVLLPALAGLIAMRSTDLDCDPDRLLDLTDQKTAFTALLSLSSSPHFSKQNELQDRISRILSTRLLRPTGLSALIRSTITDDDQSDDHQQLTIKKLDSLTYIISNCPTMMDRSTYFQHITRSSIEIICPSFFLGKPSSLHSIEGPMNSHRRTAVHVLTQIIIKQPNLFTSHIKPVIHHAFRPNEIKSSSSTADDIILISSHQISTTIDLLNDLMLNSDPSQILIDRLVMPILPQLISLIIYIYQTKSDPVLRERATSLVKLWIKINPIEYVGDRIRRSVRELEIARELNMNPKLAMVNWARDDSGSVCIKYQQSKKVDEDPMILKPSIDYLTRWLGDLSNENLIEFLLVKWLDDIEVLRTKNGFMEAKMTLLRMQLILKLIERLDCSKIKDPNNILVFVKHSLTSDSLGGSASMHSARPERDTNTAGGSSSLRFVVEPEASVETDDQYDEPIILAGLTLLLSVLEAHPTVDERRCPDLKSIRERLDVILAHNSTPSSELYDLGLKCRLMISVREALSRVDEKTKNMDQSDRLAKKESENLSERYVEGLKCIEDQCLPLRAQGIGILKQVLLTNPKFESTKKMIQNWTPKVMEIFLRLIEEGESFIYLNSIRGLSELAEKFPKEICSRLNLEYGESIDLDRRLRIGEAIVQIIQRAGTALPIYVNSMLPALLMTLNSRNVPTTIRASSVTILATCIESSFLTMMPYLNDLIDSCLMILSIEGSSQVTKSTLKEEEEEEMMRKNERNDSSEEDLSEEEEEEAEESEIKNRSKGIEEIKDPNTKDSKHPVLRRSALLLLKITFLSQFESLSSTTRRRESVFVKTYLKSVLRVLNYVGCFDDDGLVRYQAKVLYEQILEIYH